MTRHTSTAELRHDEARAAWSALDHGGREQAVLHIQCARSHHVGVVFATPAGPVFQARVRARSHGSRDRVDEIHGAGEVEFYVDFLDAEPGDDELPAWCDCGPRTLSRAAVARWVADHEKRVIID